MSDVRTASGRRIFYDDTGSGPPLLLIPGQAGDRRGCLAWLAAALAPSFRVVAMDNRDAGESEPETAYYRLADLAGDVAALLDALGISRAHVLGHSLGGKIALQLALDHPARVDRLVLVSAAADGEPAHRAGEPLPPPEAWWSDDPVERMRQALHFLVGPDYRARMGAAEAAAVAEPERGNRATWAGWMRQEAAKAGHGLPARLGAVRAPTLVVHGDGDEVVALERGQALADGIPGAWLLVLPGVGHVPWVERPEQVIGAIADFLGKAGERADGEPGRQGRPA